MTVPLQQLKGMQMSTHTRSEETATIRQRKIYERRTSVPFLSKVVHKRDQGAWPRDGTYPYKPLLSTHRPGKGVFLV